MHLHTYYNYFDIGKNNNDLLKYISFHESNFPTFLECISILIYDEENGCSRLFRNFLKLVLSYNLNLSKGKSMCILFINKMNYHLSTRSGTVSFRQLKF